MERLRELVRLHRMGASSREVVRLLRMGPNTERTYRRALQAAGLLAGSPDQLPELAELKAAVEQHMPAKAAPQQVSSIEAWRKAIERLVEAGLGPRAIHDRLRLEDEAFTGSLSAVKRFCARLRRDRGVRPGDVAIPVETDPGEIAQVDFGYAGRFYDPEQGRVRRAWVFVLVLGYSRHMVARVVFDQKTATWLRLHCQAFSELGGVPRTIVPDNLKAAVIRAAFSCEEGGPALNRSYRELARHFGFKIDPTPPRSPQKKGKVEAAVKYVKRSCLKGRDGQDVREVNALLQRWTQEIAGLREHGTTGRKPRLVFEEAERACLLPLPAQSFELALWKEAKVHPDSHVSFERRLYSVPWQLVGQRVWIRATPKTVAVYAADERVATHPRCGRLHRSTVDEHLPTHRVDLRHRSREFWERRADRIGPETGAYLREVFDSDEVLSLLRTVQSIVRHLEGFPARRAEAACRRARHFSNYTYGGIKRILARALDLEPLPGEARPLTTPAWTPRFARAPGELFSDPAHPEDAHVRSRRSDPSSQEAPPLRRAADA